MEDEFLADKMIVYIEKEIAGNFTVEMIMDEFYSMKNRRQTWFDLIDDPTWPEEWEIY